MWGSLLFSGLVALSSVGLAIAGGLFVSLYLRKPLQKGPLSLFMYWPLAIPAIVAAFAAIQLLSRAGLFARLSYAVGWISELQDFPQLINGSWGFSIVLTHALLAMPFFTLLLGNLYRSERVGELSQLAATLGASAQQQLWRVTLPILLRRLLPTALMYWVFIMGSYEIPLLLGAQRREMVSILILRKIQGADLAVIPEGYAIAIVYTTIVALFTILFYIFNRKRYE